MTDYLDKGDSMSISKWESGHVFRCRQTGEIGIVDKVVYGTKQTYIIDMESRSFEISNIVLASNIEAEIYETELKEMLKKVKLMISYAREWQLD